MSRLPSNYIIKILDHPGFTEVRNSTVPGKFGKNISIINDSLFLDDRKDHLFFLLNR